MRTMRLKRLAEAKRLVEIEAKRKAQIEAKQRAKEEELKIREKQSQDGRAKNKYHVGFRPKGRGGKARGVEGGTCRISNKKIADKVLDYLLCSNEVADLITELRVIRDVPW